jgi:hypothetical protein
MNRDRIEQLSGEILIPIRQQYLVGPTSSDRVFEVLNALAFVTAVTLAACDERARRFFDQALEQTVAELRKGAPS